MDEMLELLLKNLNADFLEIKKYKENKDFDRMKKAVHKLHGALCYCNVPPLKKAAAELEVALLQGKINQVDKFFETFKNEVNKLLMDYAQKAR